MPCAYCHEQGHNRSTCPQLTGLNNEQRVDAVNDRIQRDRMFRLQRQRQMEIEAQQRRRRMRQEEEQRRARRRQWCEDRLTMLIEHYNETADPGLPLLSPPEHMLGILGSNEISQALLNNYLTIKSSNKELVKQIDCPVETEECPICMDSLQKTDLIVTRCGHSFHCGCLFKHLSKHDNCPCCRGVLV